METLNFIDGVDALIRPFVQALVESGIETFESCQGGDGHAYPEPTIRFHGDVNEGFKALAAARRQDIPVSALRRTWVIIDNEPVGPYWEMTLTLPTGQLC